MASHVPETHLAVDAVVGVGGDRADHVGGVDVLYVRALWISKEASAKPYVQSRWNAHSPQHHRSFCRTPEDSPKEAC